MPSVSERRSSEPHRERATTQAFFALRTWAVTCGVVSIAGGYEAWLKADDADRENDLRTFEKLGV
ncbi:MAG: hypothetical protein ABI277_18520 [Burkholderiaceae bacterium]